MASTRPLKVVLAALGGQGGGVVSDWLVLVAKLEGYIAQATSVPGVAQRTGATIYYLEFFPRSAIPAPGVAPVLALMPHPGDVDVVVASELMEAGRALQRGIVTPDRTTLIASSHRIFAISEKSHRGDGRADGDELVALAREHAKRLILCDMQSIATQTGSVISAAALGCLAGSHALPFSLESYRKAIIAGGIGVKRSLAAFEAAVAAVEQAAAPTLEPQSRAGDLDIGSLPASCASFVSGLPESIRQTVAEGVRRLIDYQDESYARLYLERIVPLTRHSSDQHVRLAEAVARCLALWMSFEDTIRVADLKIRASRKARVLAEVGAKPGELIYVSEFMKPRLEEICGTLPAPLGRWLLRSPRLVRLATHFTRGYQIQTSRLAGFLLLYWLAGCRARRRSTLRYVQEDGRIRAWLALIAQVARQDPALAVEIAECQGLVKGYGATHERGLRSFVLVTQKAQSMLGDPRAAHHVAALRLAALADEDGDALSRAIG